MTTYRIRNLVSGLLVPKATFSSYEAAQRWLLRIDAPIADFEIEEAPHGDV